MTGYSADDTLRLPIDRRTIVVTSLAAGFALSVQPVWATVIVTDDSGLVSGDVKIPVGDGEIPAFRAMPANGVNLPTVIVVHEIFGVHEWMKDICQRLAKQGYLAVAPYLYSRQGDATAYTDIPKLVSEIVAKTDDATVMSDLDATSKWVAGNGGNGGRIAVTGFCWGGRVTWLYTAHNPGVKAGVAWYGQMVRREGNTQAKHPVEVAPGFKGRMLGLYGELDKGIASSQIDAMRAALAAAGDIKSEIVVYPGADHGFLADYRPSYNEAAAKDAWARALAWFKSHGV
ncbi:MAG: dienelactone hydrolase family protein [Alphaproteobacteria bacterium]|nr:dienelactone hydrolase family protein [Alphaproteobacteria bacterium]